MCSALPPSSESLMLMIGWAALRAGGDAGVDIIRPFAVAFSAPREPDSSCPLMSIVPGEGVTSPPVFSSKSLSEPANVTVERWLVDATANLVPNDLTEGKHSANRGNIMVVAR